MPIQRINSNIVRLNDKRYKTNEMLELLRSPTYWGGLAEEEVVIARDVVEKLPPTFTAGEFLSAFADKLPTIETYETDQHCEFGIERIGIKDRKCGNTLVVCAHLDGGFGQAHFGSYPPCEMENIRDETECEAQEHVEESYRGCQIDLSCEDCRMRHNIDDEVGEKQYELQKERTHDRSVLGFCRYFVKNRGIYCVELQSDLMRNGASDMAELRGAHFPYSIVAKRWRELVLNSLLDVCGQYDRAMNVYLATPYTVCMVEGFMTFADGGRLYVFPKGTHKVGDLVQHCTEEGGIVHAYIIGVFDEEEGQVAHDKYAIIPEGEIATNDEKNLMKRLKKKTGEFETVEELQQWVKEQALKWRVDTMSESAESVIDYYMQQQNSKPPTFAEYCERLKTLVDEKKEVLRSYREGGETYRAACRLLGRRNLDLHKDERGFTWWDITNDKK